jgi:uncharacterized protein (TIGR02246 family)
MKKLLLFAALVGLVALPNARADKKDDEDAIHKRHEEWVAAWNKHDPKLMASFWVEEGDVITPTGRVCKGRGEIEKLFQDEQTGTGPWVGTTYAGTITDIRFIGKTTTVVDVDAEVSGAKGPDGNVMPPMKHHVTWVAVKKHGKWMAFATRPCIPHMPPPPPQ